MAEPTSAVAPVWRDDDHLLVGSTTFRVFGEEVGRLDAEEFLRIRHLRSTPEHFVLAKPKGVVEQYLALLAQLRPETILELGVYQGGSVALFAEIARPSKLVAVELEPHPIAVLDDFLRTRHLDGVVSVHYGVDQSDRARVTGIFEHEFSSPIDLVVDDASHFLAETRCSFDVFFPRVRPGGIYIIEDWSWAHTTEWRLAEALDAANRGLAPLIVELLLSCALVPGLVERVTVSRELVVVRRGPAECDPESFALSELLAERDRRLIGQNSSGIWVSGG